MTRTSWRSLLLGLFGLCAAGPAAAGTLSGVVRNGTTGSPAAGADVVLLQLQGGMEAVANTKTDAQGRYRLEHAGIGAQPMLVRVVYRGVAFHQNLPPGRNSADIEVFEPTTNAGVLRVTSRMIVLQPNGPVLLVGEEYAIQNGSKPPAAYYEQTGSFEFQVPEGGELAQVSAWGPAGMPVVQGTIDRGKNRYAIAFAFRPGASGVRLSYQIPYSANQAVLRAVSPLAAERVLLLAPPSIQVSSAGFQPSGTEQGWSVYARDAVPAGALFDISVFGTAPPPSMTAQEQSEPQGRDSARGGQAAQVLPDRLDSLKWVLVGGFAALFALGMGLLWRRPARAAAVLQGAVPESPRARRSEPKVEESVAAAQVAAEVERHITRSLDHLKDTLLRLELRRQAGTISEEEYARERGRAEQALRELVKG